MPLKPQNSSFVSEGSLGSLHGCLVEGDAEQRHCERRTRRRALALSIALQSAILAALVLVPLFGKSERIVLAYPTPIPPYSSYKGPSHDAGAQHPHGDLHRSCHFCAPTNISPIIVTHDSPSGESDDAVPDGLVPGIPGGPGGGLIPIVGPRTNVPPPPEDHHVTRPSILHVTHLDPALLIHRVEPVYPPLARQTRREGRVELRAIIGTDGTIQFLQVVAGDPLLVPSAIEAVQQWRYRPTILNGQPVQIDTYITVVYTLQH